MSIEIKDLVGLSKPIEKLIEVCAQGMGALVKPYLLKKLADAKAYEIKTIAEANRDAGCEVVKIEADSQGVKLSGIAEADATLQRAAARFAYQQRQKQINLEAIAQLTAIELHGETEVSDEPLDHDWIVRFFQTAEDISAEDMRKLFARILAGEIKSPRSFSLRALDVIRNLSRREAETFAKMAGLGGWHGNRGFLMKKPFISGGETYGIRFRDIVTLQDANLMGEGSSTFAIPASNAGEETCLVFGTKVLVIRNKANFPMRDLFKVYRFTNAGLELLRLLKAAPHTNYLNDLIQALRHTSTELFQADFKKEAGEKVEYQNPTPLS
jgi:hypothetical protein